MRRFQKFELLYGNKFLPCLVQLQWTVHRGGMIDKRHKEDYWQHARRATTLTALDLVSGSLKVHTVRNICCFNSWLTSRLLANLISFSCSSEICINLALAFARSLWNWARACKVGRTTFCVTSFWKTAGWVPCFRCRLLCERPDSRLTGQGFVACVLESLQAVYEKTADDTHPQSWITRFDSRE